MYFRILHDEHRGSVSYLLADLDAAEAVLIDPRGADVPVLAAMLDEHRLRLRWLLRTHEHDAQLPGEAAALEALGAPWVQHAVPRAPASAPAHAHAQPRAERHTGSPAGSSDGLCVFGQEHVQVIATPGHTAACLSFLWRDRLFCGGLLAVDACPWQPRPAQPQALWDSVTQSVFNRPAETLLFHGHAIQARCVSSVLHERRWHPWLGNASRDDFLARLQAAPAP